MEIAGKNIGDRPLILAPMFGVVCSDFSNSPLKITNETTPLIYEQMRQASVGMESAILKDEKTVPYDNMLIKEVEYSIIKDNYEMTYFKRFIFRDNIPSENINHPPVGRCKKKSFSFLHRNFLHMLPQGEETVLDNIFSQLLIVTSF